ncbi:lytic transglycosylase domain-containing protein [Desulfallas sp. Bu1-1]|uniref:lytic transglycosylase domain-containing protein n=1 Tax=Desulfallas sp. Bu1-1 TaxID=2787620 RepID=UPI00189F39D7|nr:lytic transglycosylase domain-containing protein [Desulfallas sp. Bu1-1]MBF7083948.1 lytic transglycosylase domain-containing protein [Desulfallas sp. Bu1-1]
MITIINTLVRLFLDNYQSLVYGQRTNYYNGLGQGFAEILLSSLSKQENNILTTHQVAKVMPGRPQSTDFQKPVTTSQVLPETNKLLDKRELEKLVEEISSKHGVDPALVKSVIQVESGFNPSAVSPAGAMGLMQLMPATAASLGIRDPFNPVQNIEGGVRYLKQMLNRYKGNVHLALAAYNSGPGTVDRAGGMPDYPETKSYVQRVLKKRLNVTV